MGSFYYAQLNEESIVIGISELSGEVSNEKLIRIDNFNENLLGKKYKNGEFIEVPKTKEQLLDELKQQYLKLINEANLLGDTEEVTRLQQEYQQKKSEIENA